MPSALLAVGRDGQETRREALERVGSSSLRERSKASPHNHQKIAGMAADSGDQGRWLQVSLGHRLSRRHDEQLVQNLERQLAGARDLGANFAFQPSWARLWWPAFACTLDCRRDTISHQEVLGQNSSADRRLGTSAVWPSTRCCLAVAGSLDGDHR